MSLDVDVAPDITLTFGVPVMIHMAPGAAPFNDEVAGKGIRRAGTAHSVDCFDHMR
ncbi:MAG TPA: hypothetical protein VE914_06490 [Candidatus Angelobacter sp.]|nr:hypothetical protein [Candidatus Angelobacter sp.]